MIDDLLDEDYMVSTCTFNEQKQKFVDAICDGALSREENLVGDINGANWHGKFFILCYRVKIFSRVVTCNITRGHSKLMIMCIIDEDAAVP